MKLIDLLVKELGKDLGWPNGANHCVQDDNGSVWFFSGGTPKYFASMWAADSDSKDFDWVGRVRVLLTEKADDNTCAIISREQYESALAALTETAPQQIESLAWDGEGLPPIGCECEYLDYNNHWYPVRVMYASEWLIVVRSLAEDGGKGVDIARSIHVEMPSFRTIRTEAERKREEAVGAMNGHMFKMTRELACQVYDHIAAGEIPGIKLED